MIIQLLLISYNYLLFPARPCCFTLYILYSHSVVPLACLVCKQSADSWVLFPAEPDIPNGASTFKALHSTSNVTVVQSVNVFFHVASYWIFPLCFLTICLSVTVPVSAFEILMQVYVCFFYLPRVLFCNNKGKQIWLFCESNAWADAGLTDKWSCRRSLWMLMFSLCLLRSAARS